MSDTKIYIPKIIERYLKANKVSFRHSDVRMTLLSDPEFPSLRSLIETLGRFGVEACPYEADYEHFVQLRCPMIIHTKTHDDEGRFFYCEQREDDRILLYDGQNKTVDAETFRAVWDGILVKTENIKKIPAGPRQFRNLSMTLALTTAAVMTFISLFNSTFTMPLILTLSAAVLLYQQFMSYIDSSYTSLLCHKGRYLSCNALKSTKFSKHIACAGMVYALYASIIHVLSVKVYAFTQIAGAAALCFIALLIAYQCRIKKFCIPCLTASALMGCDAILSLTAQTVHYGLNQTTIAATVATTVTMMLAYTAVNDHELEDKSIRLTRLKRDGDVFTVQWLKAEECHMEPGTIILGNKKSDKIVKTVVSTECRHCLKLCRTMDRLLNHGVDLRWEVFFDGTTDTDNTQTSKVRKFIQAYKKAGSMELNSFMFLSKISEGMDEEDIKDSEFLKQQFTETGRHNFKHIPVVVYKDRILPTTYDVEDLKWLP